MKKLLALKLLPEKDRSYENAPWTWVLFLVLIELAIGAIAVIVLAILQTKTHSWIGMVAAMTASMSFAMYAEASQRGVLTEKIKRQLALRASIVLTIIGVVYFWLLQLMATDETFQLPWYWLIVIVAVAFVFNWLAHKFGLNQGQKHSAAQSAK